MAGRYIGQAVVVLLEDGRRVQLSAPFEYVDPGEKNWPVPKDAIVDGASIPRALWTIIGGPFEGKYRDASIIHDWYCDRRSRAWRTVHRMFFEAMLTSGVPQTQARVMYAGVYWGGPRWSDTTAHNNRLADRLWDYLATGYRRTASTYSHKLTEADVELLQREIATRDLNTHEIEQYVDRRLPSDLLFEW